MIALATYQEQITEHLKHGKRSDLPSPLDAIDLLLALGTPAGYRAAERLAELLFRIRPDALREAADFLQGKIVGISYSAQLEAQRGIDPNHDIPRFREEQIRILESAAKGLLFRADDVERAALALREAGE